LTTGAAEGYESSVQSQWTRRLETLSIALILLAGVWFFFGQFFSTKFDAVLGDLGDSRLNALFLEHSYRHLQGDPWHRALWSPKWAFFPHKNVLAYSDNLLGTLPLYIIPRLVGFREMAALNTWAVVLSVANFASMALLLRGLQLSRLSAALGGFVFAFAMPRGEQLNHLQLLPQFFTPLCFYFLVKMRELHPGAVWGAVGCAVLQLYAAVYVGWFLALALGATAIVMAVVVAVSGSFRDSVVAGLRRLWLHGIGASVLGGATLIPLGFHYARAQMEVGPRDYEEISLMLPRPASYLLPADYTAVYRPMLKLKQSLPVAHEHVMFAGFLVMLCVIVMLASLIRAPRKIADNPWNCVWLVILLATASMTLYVNGSLWHVLHRVIPGGGAIRAVSRIALLQLLPLGAAAAWAVDRIAKRRGIAVAVLFAALVVIENSGVAHYHFSARDHRARIERIKSKLAGQQCKAFLVSGSGDTYKTQLDAMWASLETKTPTLNGYSGNTPPNWPWSDLQDVSRAPIRRWMRRHHVHGVHVCVLDP